MQTAMDNGGDQDPQTLAVAALARTWPVIGTLRGDTIDSAIDLNENGVELYLWARRSAWRWATATRPSTG
ncbi:MAG: hypothetical protein R2789_04585 [Microthrixaceae bacterium]